MRKITENELQEILRKHKLWLNREEGGERADMWEADLSEANLTEAVLSGADLSEANLTRANLSEADLSRANLSGANLRRADLSGACLREANLRRADLSGACLREANLRRACLIGADLSEADQWLSDLREANLSGADLSEADLSGADLSEANLTRANLSEADQSGANLSGANLWLSVLRGAKNIPYIPIACPEEGSFIGFKKACIDLFGHQPVIVKLLILEDAKRSSATSNKCRCSKAKVLDIQDILGNSVDIVAYSKYDNTFKYEVGKVVEVKDFDENRFNECAPGIHFFINRQDAVNY